MSKFSAANPYPAVRIDSAGIPVLWRPFHENNGAFFWWGQQPRFKELWQQMYHYYVDSLHLDNLLWVYSMCYFPEGDTWIDSLYPGEKYVDALGADIYNSCGQPYGDWIYSTIPTRWTRWITISPPTTTCSFPRPRRLPTAAPSRSPPMRTGGTFRAPR